MKKLVTFIALFCVVQMNFASEVFDVTSQYMQNYMAPFTATGVSVIIIDGVENARFQEIAAPWKTSGNNVNGTVTTGWHVDFGKYPRYPDNSGAKGCINISDTWDGFATSVTNAKVFQTVTLPAGSYEFVAQRAQDWGTTSNIRLVVAAGDSIPNMQDVSTAIGSSLMATGVTPDFKVSVPFILTAETKVSLGMVATFANAKSALNIAQFQILQIVGANYNSLISQVNAAKSLPTVIYPIGTISGTYPQEKWDALQAVITASQAMIDGGQNTQAEVDAQKVVLQNAIDDLNASLKLPFVLSDASSTTWYQIRDRRSPNDYWTIGQYTSTDGLTNYPLALLITTTSDATSDYQLFKIIKAPAPAKGYYICSKVIEDVPLTVSQSLGMGVIDFDGSLGVSPTPLLFGATVSAANYTVFLEGDYTAQLNSYTRSTPKYWGFWFPGYGKDDAGNDMEFVPFIEIGQTDFKPFNDLVAVAARMTPDLYPLGTNQYEYSAEKWNNFVTVRTSSINFMNNETPSVLQATVDSAKNVLQVAISDLKMSMVPGYKISDETNKYWYMIHDNRSPNSYWRIADLQRKSEGIFPADTVIYSKRLTVVRGLPAVVDDSYLFKLVKAPAPATGYYIYNKLNEIAPLYGDSANNVLAIDSVVTADKWTSFNVTLSTGIDKNYIISQEGVIITNQLNSYMRNPDYVAYYNNVTDSGNNWAFVTYVPTGINTPKVNNIVDVYVANKMIVARNSSDRLIVYNIYGQRVDARKQLQIGIYVVQVEGKAGSMKVLVK